VSGSVSSAGDIYDATGTLRVAGANMPGGSNGDVLTSDANGNLSLQAPAGGGGGTVTSVTVESANGLAGTVNDAETTPQITLSTTVTGLLKGNGTAVSAATAGTDYLAPAGSGAALTGITATQVGADASGAAAAAQAAAIAASVPVSDLPLSVANGGSGTALQVPGATPFNPVMLAPVKWAFVNYDVAQYQLGATYSYSNGTAGVGATITAGANGVLSIDGGSPSVGDRVLVSDGYAHGTGNSPYVDGTYVVTSVGSASSEWVLTRASDTNTAATLFQYWGVQITSGTQFGGGYGVVTALSGTAGTGPQTYAVSTSFLQMSIAGPSAWAAGTRCVAMGQQATAIGTQATAAANNATAIGNTSYATGTASTAVGYTSKASGQQSIAIGSFCYAPARNSSAYGVGSSASSQNQEAFASGNSGPAGSQQHTRLCQYATTTSATPASLASSNSAALVLQTYQELADYSKTIYFRANVVARRTDQYGTDSVWTFAGVLRGSGSASATTVAAGSTGGEISAIASWSSPSAGVLDVASTTGYPSSGTLHVAASGSTTAVVTYTGISGNSFTGCAYVSGSATGTVSTGGAVSLVDAYSWVGGSAPTATLVAQDSAASAWAVAVAVSANTVTFTVTGSAGETIGWLAVIDMDELVG
jgi:trimeric autotransporter adhesin